MSGQDELTGRTGDTRTRIAEDMDTEVADALSVAVITRWIVDMLILGSANDTPIIGLPRWKESILQKRNDITAVGGLHDVDRMGG
jgi:hypothetical protein